MSRLDCGCRSHPDPGWMAGYDVLPLYSPEPCPGPRCGVHGTPCKIYERTEVAPGERYGLLCRYQLGAEVLACDECAAALAGLIREAS